MTLLSICIPTYNRADLLEYCLQNLRALDGKLDYEVVVTDHASPDHTQDVLKKAKSKWDNIRSYRQEHQVGLECQFNTCLRMGRGKYTVFLPDDDKFIPEKLVEYVRYLEQHPDMTALYAPWLAYDDENDKVLHGYFTVPERRTFTAQDPIALFNFIAARQVFPESAIFRTDALHSIMMSHPTAPYQWFLMLYAMLRKGSVVFETEPFYLEVAQVKPHLKRESRVNIDVNTSHLDQFRAGVEIMLSRMMMDYGHEKLPDQIRNNLHEILLNYAHNRLIVAFNRALAAGQFIQAVEYAQRVMLWRGLFDPEIVKKSHAIYGAAAVQAVAVLFRNASWLKEIYVCGFKKPADMIVALQSHLSGTEIREVEKQAVAEHAEPETLLVLVKNTADKTELQEGNVPPGNIVSLAEVAEYYQLIPAKRHFEDL